MEKLIFILLLSIGVMNHAFSSDPVIKKVINSSEVEVSCSDVEYNKYFASAYFNSKTNSINFESLGFIKYIQILSESGKLLYQLPVMSSKVRISKAMFKKGKFKLGFLLRDKANVVFTDLTVN
jgi:hypothetical protein